MTQPRTHIDIPGFVKGWQRLRKCHRSYGTGHLMHLRLIGVSGVAKTFLAKQYCAAHPARDVGEATHVPVIYFAIPREPTTKSMYQAFLKGFGARSMNGTANEIKDRVVALCEACRVEFVIVDEIQHFVDHGGARALMAAADALKEMIELLERPFVLAGAPRSAALFLHNGQLRSRVMPTYRMHPFSLDDLSELMGFVYALVPDLPEKVRQWLACAETTTRIFYATDGIHRTVGEYVHRAAVVLTDGSSSNYATLSEVFREHIWATPASGLNPFERDFAMRRLNRPGEPYEPSIFDGDNHAHVVV
jgi:hypothetical protein